MTYSNDTRYCTQTIEPPCTERYARWCERPAIQIMGKSSTRFEQISFQPIRAEIIAEPFKNGVNAMLVRLTKVHF